jgi:L-lactate dehydrogenase complex protein LldG
MRPGNRERMREVIGRAVRTGLFPGGVAPHPPAHGTNDLGVDVLPATAIAGSAAAAPPASALPPRQRFRAALEAIAGVVHDASSIEAAADIVAGLARRLGTTSLLAWSDEAMEVPGLGAALAARGLTPVEADVPQAPGPAREARLTALAALPLGVTGADAGLADTGSVVVATGPGRPRLASLLVPVHVAILPVDRLVPSIAELFAKRGDLVAAGSNLVCITGPSRTADIEHTLSRGVHGPGEVHVILLDT